MATKLQHIPDSFFQPLMGADFVYFTPALQIAPMSMMAGVGHKKMIF
jgi:hypothetical protein